MEHSEQPVQIVRRFNRAYTRHLGLLDARHLGTEFGLTETRVLYELAHRRQLTATTRAGAEARPGVPERILRSFERRGLVRRTTSVEDRRRATLALTPRGRSTFRRLDALATAHVGRMLEALPGPRQAELVRALDQVHRMLEPGPGSETGVVLRPFRTGDLGWIVERHGALYAAEYGWDERFEALVAGVVADFGRAHDPAREACWIAEWNGARVGSVMLVGHPQRAGVAQLRLLLLEPSARGLGIGKALVDACSRFARGAGYHTITSDAVDPRRPRYLRPRRLSPGLGGPEQRLRGRTGGRDLGARPVSTFKDHFSGAASGYAAHRPGYPLAVAEALAARSPGRGCAWDAGCGSGQLSTVLGEVFERVVATDASAAQIAAALPHPRVRYAVAPAEHSDLPDGAWTAQSLRRPHTGSTWRRTTGRSGGCSGLAGWWRW
jgi:DNA-binding MarR family transcriptional regulator/GNAT superfamily N-acetyltransferase